MKLTRLLAIGLLAVAPLLSPAAPTQATTLAPGQALQGQVLETKNVPPYTYLRLKTAQGEQWAVVDQTAVLTGDQVSVDIVMVVDNFESQTLKQRFAQIVFGNLAGAKPGASNPHASVANMPEASPQKLTKASGPNAHTVAEIIGQAASLQGKTVQVRGKVVKFNPSIMGKNWLHLQDGSGQAANQTHDILVTTLAPAKPGEVLTVSGVVRTQVDLGMGYTYPVLIEATSLSSAAP